MRSVVVINAALIASAQAGLIFTDLSDYVNDIEKCELLCWEKTASEISCSNTDFNCVCQGAGMDFIEEALVCWSNSCNGTGVQMVHMDDLCKYVRYKNPSESDVADAQKLLSERLADPDMPVTKKTSSETASATSSTKGGASASKTTTGLSASKTTGASATDKPSSGGVTGVSFGLLGAAGFGAILL